MGTCVYCRPMHNGVCSVALEAPHYLNCKSLIGLSSTDSQLQILSRLGLCVVTGRKAVTNRPNSNMEVVLVMLGISDMFTCHITAQLLNNLA